MGFEGAFAMAPLLCTDGRPSTKVRLARPAEPAKLYYDVLVQCVPRRHFIFDSCSGQRSKEERKKEGKKERKKESSLLVFWIPFLENGAKLVEATAQMRNILLSLSHTQRENWAQ